MKKKSLVFLLSLTFPFISQAQSVGGSGSGGGGLITHQAPKNPGCIEGRRSFMTDYDASKDRMVTVLRECRNGSYYDLSDYIYNPKSRCKEGSRALWQDSDRNQNLMAYTCRNGKWTPVDY